MKEMIGRIMILKELTTEQVDLIHKKEKSMGRRLAPREININYNHGLNYWPSRTTEDHKEDEAQRLESIVWSCQPKGAEMAEFPTFLEFQHEWDKRLLSQAFTVAKTISQRSKIQDSLIPLSESV